MKAAVVGFGSIGSRHARTLRNLNHEVFVVSARANSEFPRFTSLGELMRLQSVEYTIIASPTSQHFSNLSELSRSKFAGTILIEKPLFHEPRPVPPLVTSRVAIGYHLRFHPLTHLLKQAVDNLEHVDFASFHVGQLLTTWRPGRDYRETSSAKLNLGGGLLRDLSHEFDLALFLFGEILDISVSASHSGVLEVEGPDKLTLITKTQSCDHLEIHLNYLDNPPQRTTTLISGNRVLKADYIQNRWEQDSTVQVIETLRGDIYKAMHQAIISGDFSSCASLNDGLHVVQLIARIEKQLDEISL